MNYKIEVDAKNVEELIFKLQETAIQIQHNLNFYQKMNSKTVNSTFFTAYATIEIEDEELS